MHIVGGAGQGKSTLARQLAGGLGAPLYHLDTLNFVGATDRQRIAAGPPWVSEGIFLGRTDLLLQAADHIIWLDPSRHIALYRIMRRYRRASYRGTNQYRGLRRLLRFLRWSAAHYQHMSRAQIDALSEESLHSRAATARHLRLYTDKLIRCCTPAEVNDLRAELGLAGGT